MDADSNHSSGGTKPKERSRRHERIEGKTAAYVSLCTKRRFVSFRNSICHDRRKPQQPFYTCKGTCSDHNRFFGGGNLTQHMR